MAGALQEVQRPDSELKAVRRTGGPRAIDPQPEGLLLKPERLNRYLARHGVCSRRAADELITSGAVTVNNRRTTRLGVTVDPENDVVHVHGQRVLAALDPKVLMLNKPVGVLSTCKLSREEGTIILDYLPKDRRYFPVGRLDRDSAGLMLITDDGDLAHRLAHPSFGSRKVYRVEVHPQLEYKQAMRLVRGIELADGLARAIEVTQVTASVYDVTLGDGRKRQLRRMITALGSHVISLTRIEQAGIKLGSLRPGRWRELTPTELRLLRAKFAQPTTSKHTED